MKRASLKDAKVSTIGNPSPDVTDKLLKAHRDPAARKPRSPAKRSKVAPEAGQALAGGSIPAESVKQALAQTRSALEALRRARTTAPAQYDLALRVRLDSLAHHLNQVAEFVLHRRA